MNQNETMTEVLAFNLEKAKEFVAQNTYKFPEEIIKQFESGEFPFKLECIDDRRGGEQGELVLAIPGAGLGVVMDVLGGVKILNDQTAGEFKLTPEEAYTSVQNVLGTVSYHTDQANVDNHNPLFCAGCGHCAGALKNPGDYLQTEEAVDFVGNKLLLDLKQSGVLPSVYPGAHDASLVVIVDNLTDGITSKGEETQAYVYNKAWHEKILETISKKLAEGQSVSSDEIFSALREAKDVRLNHTIEHLAKNHPKFVLHEDGDVTEL